MLIACGAAVSLAACGNGSSQEDNFRYLVDEFADIKIMRYQIPGWDSLSLQQKQYVYHLGEAAKYGRDIIWMQNCRYNLPVRHLVEDILDRYDGDRECDDFRKFTVYAKRLFFSNGMHHHYAEDKFFPECPREYFASLVNAIGSDGIWLDPEDKAKVDLLEVIYSPDIAPQRKSTDRSGDIVKESAVNFYKGVTRDEAETFYAALVDPADSTPVSYGLNSRLVKDADSTIREEVYTSMSVSPSYSVSRYRPSKVPSV